MGEIVDITATCLEGFSRFFPLSLCTDLLTWAAKEYLVGLIPRVQDIIVKKLSLTYFLNCVQKAYDVVLLGFSVFVLFDHDAGQSWVTSLLKF